MILDEQGYPKLIDFGTAKVVNHRTFTMVGTPHYMAPEILISKGYGFTADLWSLGVMLYEFLCGGVPFGEELEDTYKVYEQVMKGKLLYPRFIPQDFPARTLIQQLLNRNPAARGDPTSIRKHPYFADIKWNQLLT